MTDIYTYLKDYREEEPEWIGKYLCGEQITFKDIMSSRIGYYPGYYTKLECDGSLIKVGCKSHSVHSFLYVDYQVTRNKLEEQIAEKNSFYGYHLVRRIEWKELDIMPSGRHQILKPIHNIQETPYCFSIILKRDEDKDDTWGAEHFAVTFLFGRGTDVYYWIIRKEYLKAPWIFILNERYYKGTSFEQNIQRCHYPKFALFTTEKQVLKGYEKVKQVSNMLGVFERSFDLYKFVNQ